MKELYILRHAKSSWAEPGLSDHDRPLNKRGRSQCETLSQWLPESSVRPEMILCSTAARTIETHERLAKSLGNPAVEHEVNLYGGTIESYMECLWERSADRIMIVGHNPACDELARHLAAPSSPAFEALMARHFGTGTLAVFEFAGDSWAGLQEGSCSLTQVIRPRDLETTESV